LSNAAWLVVGAAALVAAVFLFPRLLIARAQDRLAREKMMREGDSLRLLTRAELVIGRYKRIPGLLSWRDDVLAFQGISGHTVNIPPSRIQKIVTADRIASGRLLFRLEVLRLMDTDGQELEFVVARNTANQWRSLLGAWAGQERQIAAAPDAPDVVTRGLK
jgi:hypothetical protein